MADGSKSKAEDTMLDFQIKYTDGWTTVVTHDESIGPFVYGYWKRHYKNFHTRFVRRSKKDYEYESLHRTHGRTI